MYNVLIVDDELAVFRGLENILCWEEFGLEIVAKAKNGRTALDAISKHEIDLLITDIKLIVLYQFRIEIASYMYGALSLPVRMGGILRFFGVILVKICVFECMNDEV